MKAKRKKISNGYEAESYSLLRKLDKITILVFVILFAASVAAYWLMMDRFGFTIYTGLPVMATPFFVIGLAFYVISKRYITAIFIIGLAVVLYFVFPSSVLFLLYLLVCTEGVAQMVEIIQRWMFYGVMETVKHVNIKKKMSIKDRIIVFFFNIPVDIDTRNITIDKDVTRNKLPWRDMFNSMMLALLFCMFLWIYVFLNPNISLETKGVPIYTFTIVLYLSMLVMPWTIFSSLNVRVSTEYRDFKLYSGFLGTFKRMFLPVFAAILFLIVALSSGPDNLYYVGMSLGMIVVMIVFTSVMYYTSNEISVVNDILHRWPSYQPSEMYSRYETKEDVISIDDVPGTPRRDPSDCFLTDLRTRTR